MTGPARREVMISGLVIGSIWAIGAVLPIGVDGIGTIYVVADYAYSVMLVSFVAIAWLAVRQAPGRAGVRIFAWVLAVAGLTGAVGNYLEDILAVPGSEYLYGIGLLGVLVGFLGLAAALLVARRIRWALAVAATFAGLISMAGHGPPVVPLLWFAIVGWSVLGDRRVANEDSVPRSS